MQPAHNAATGTRDLQSVSLVEEPANEVGKQSCRVCLEEDTTDKLTKPCCCSGSMQFVHQNCLQLWINEKGSKLCEICKQPYQGQYSDPPPRRPVHASNAALLAHLRRHGVILRANAANEPISLQRQDEVQDVEDPEDAQSGIAWCFAAILAFMAMLLIRHIFELFDRGMSDGPAAHSRQEAGDSHNPFGMDGNPSAGMLVMWLIVRFLVILIPMYAVLRVMHSVRDQQMQQDADREIEQEMMTLLWSMEAGILNEQLPAVQRNRAAAATGDRSSAQHETRGTQLPIII